MQSSNPRKPLAEATGMTRATIIRAFRPTGRFAIRAFGTLAYCGVDRVIPPASAGGVWWDGCIVERSGTFDRKPLAEVTLPETVAKSRVYG